MAFERRSSERACVFFKRVVATPGDELSFRDGRPIVNGEEVLADVIQPCSAGASSGSASALGCRCPLMISSNLRIRLPGSLGSASFSPFKACYCEREKSVRQSVMRAAIIRRAPPIPTVQTPAPGDASPATTSESSLRYSIGSVVPAKMAKPINAPPARNVRGRVICTTAATNAATATATGAAASSFQFNATGRSRLSNVSIRRVSR